MKTKVVERKMGRSRKLAEWQSLVLTSLRATPRLRFRRLKSHEQVVRGDYLEEGKERYEMWEGPAGFRADSFFKKVYRQAPGRR